MSELEGKSLGKLLVPTLLFPNLSQQAQGLSCLPVRLCSFLLNNRIMNSAYAPTCTSSHGSGLVQDLLTFSLLPRVARLNTGSPVNFEFRINITFWYKCAPNTAWDILILKSVIWNSDLPGCLIFLFAKSGYPSFIFPFTLVGAFGPFMNLG